MKLSDLTDSVLTRMFSAATPILFLGKSGLGKTERVYQFAEKSTLGMVPYNLTTIDPVDIRGFPIPSKRGDGMAVTKFALSPIIEAIERNGAKRGILFLDEILACEHIVQKAVAPILSEGMAGEYPLPDGWVVWLASNRPEDKAGVVRLLGHVTNRMCILHVEPDVQGWMKWAAGAGVHPLYMAFAKQRPGVIFDATPPKDSTRPYCTPRSLVNACAFHTQGLSQANYMALGTDTITQEFIAGYIGDGAAADLVAYLMVRDEIPDIEDIEADPFSAKVPSDSRLDAQVAVSQMVVHFVNASNVENLMHYVKRLNKEFQTTTVKQMLDKSAGALLNSPALTEWMSENKALVVATYS